MTTRVTSDHIFFWQKNRVMANDSGGHLPIAPYQPQDLSPVSYLTEYFWKRCLNEGIPVEAKRVP